MLWKKDTLFCDMNPLFYKISEKKEMIKRKWQDNHTEETFAGECYAPKLDNLVAEHKSGLIKKGKGIDPTLQYNKAHNIELACKAISGIVIRPGETFSFWQTVGNTTKKRGYLDGRVIEGNKIKPGVGGGLCNLATSLHYMVLHSPLDVTEFHNHSDALAPDHGERVPFATGTSVSYNNVDYRFKNNTDQNFQLVVWCADEIQYSELRSEREIPYEYRLVEENHRFRKEGEKYFRVSKIYRETIDKETGEVIKKELLLDNHSEVMYDYSMIPQDQIKDE